jgi:hypothetical protein
VLTDQGLIFAALECLDWLMNVLDLTANQLKRAAAIKEQIANLNKKLGSILGVQADSGAAPRKKRSMSKSARRKISAGQKARWAKLLGAKPATRSAKPAAQSRKKSMSRATKAKLSARMKAYWKAKRAGQK